MHVAADIINQTRFSLDSLGGLQIPVTTDTYPQEKPMGLYNKYVYLSAPKICSNAALSPLNDLINGLIMAFMRAVLWVGYKMRQTE